MSPAQLSKHWRLWQAACKAQGWRTTDDQKRYECYASAMDACQAQGFVVPALAGPEATYSSKHFDTQDQIDSLYDLLTQLGTNNTSLAASMRQVDPDLGPRKRLTYAIQDRHDEALWRHIAQDKFGNDTLADLTVEQLTQLRNTCDARAAARKRKRLEPYDRAEQKRALAHAEADDNAPF